MAKTRIIAALAAAVCAFGSIGSMCINASAATESDVMNTLRNAGWSSWMIEIVTNTIAGGEYSSEDYDQMVAEASTYNEAVERKIWEIYFPGVPFPERATGTTETTKPAENTAQGTTPKPPKPFSQMTTKEQTAFLESLSDAEKREFFASLSSEEKSALIEKMSLSEKAELVELLSETLREFGIFVSVDEISGDDVTLSTYDENGKLLGIQSMSITVDPTGKPYTAPVLIGSGMMLFALTGTVFTLRRKNIINITSRGDQWSPVDKIDIKNTRSYYGQEERI